MVEPYLIVDTDYTDYILLNSGQVEKIKISITDMLREERKQNHRKYLIKKIFAP